MSDRQLLVKFDPEGDTLVISFFHYEGRARGKRVDEYRTIMVHEHDEPVSVELYFVNKGINLNGLPCAEEIAAALKAFPRLAA
jgi:hypothetical protein